MKIGIDVSQIVYETGVSWYTQNLVENLLKIDTHNQYVLLGGAVRQAEKLKKKLSPFKSRAGIKQYPISPVMADRLWNKLHYFPMEIFSGKLDILHTSDWAEPYSRAKKITTIHDLSPFIFPEFVTNDRLRNILVVHKRKYEWVKKEKVRVVAVSESTKKDAIEILGLDEKQISVVYEAADEVYQPRPFYQIKTVREKYGIKRNYLLFVGTSPRKNLHNTLAAFRLLKNKDNLDLVVVGHQKPKEDGIVFIKSPTNQELSCLYSGALVFVYPSFYEGFGLPALEAMSCGCPVLAGKNSSLPEIVGRAGILVRPQSPFDIACGIEELIKKRQTYKQLGFKQAKLFSWEKTAWETLDLYRHL